MKDDIAYLGAVAQRTATNRDGHRVTVGRKALRAGLNLIATDLLSVLPVFASIIEEVMITGDRVICFHDSTRLYGFSSAFDVLNIGGKIDGAQLRESDGKHIAAYALQHPKRHIFIDLSALHSGSPARLVAEFGKAYRGGRQDVAPFELVAHYGIHRSITRARDGIGDTRATHDAMRFQHLAEVHNIGILNAANSLSELPREFVTNCPNLAFGRITIPKHYNELGSHVPEDDMLRLRVCKRDEGLGVMKVANGPLTYYPGSDVPNDLGREMPFILLPNALKSDVGKDPTQRLKPKKNKHVEAFKDFIDESRGETMRQAEIERAERIAGKAVQGMKDKAVRAAAVARAQAATLDPVARVAPEAGTRRARRSCSNVVKVDFGNAAVGTDTAVRTIETMLATAGVPHADILSRHGSQVVNTRDGQPNGSSRAPLKPQSVAVRIIQEPLVQEAILAAHDLAHDDHEDRISVAAVAAAYLRALRDDAETARRFRAERLGDDAGIANRLRRIGLEAEGARRDQSQFQLVRSAWTSFLAGGETLPNAA